MSMALPGIEKSFIEPVMIDMHKTGNSGPEH